jgi:hypothetical protein
LSGAGALLAIAGAGVVLSILPVQAQERPDYRDFTLGSSVARLVGQVGAAPADITLVHQRPALMQDLRWRAPYPRGDATAPKADPVQQIVFSFSNDQLFRMMVDYDRNLTDGMTDADMIAALSEQYGAPLTSARPLTTSPTRSTGGPAPTQATGEWTTAVAQWGDGDRLVVLLRRAFTAGFQVAITSARLESFATAAGAEAIRLDASEAPARDLVRQQQDTEQARIAQEKARAANKAAFRP